MKKILIIAMLIGSAFGYCQEAKKFNIPLLTDGMITRFSAHQIPDNSVQDALNVLFDEDIGIVRRKGYNKYNTSAIGSSTDVRGLWDFTANDGTRYIMAVSNGNLYESDGDGIFATVTGITGLTATAQYDAVQYLGEFWLTNGVNNVKSWDASSATDVSTAPKGTMIEGWRNRIIISGVSGNQSRVYLSEELVGSNFTTGATLSTSPVILSIGGVDAKPVKCLYAGYKDTLIVFTEDELYAVYGFGFNDFAVRRVSNEVGCIDDRTVREKDGNLYWLSRRGLEKWRGTEIIRISDPIRNLFDNILSNIADNRFLLDTTQAEWEEGNQVAAGAGYPISSTQIPASIEPEKNTIEDTDFTQGTVSDASDLTAVDGSLTSIPRYTEVIDTEAEFDLGTYADTEYSSGLKLKFEDALPDFDTATPCEFAKRGLPPLSTYWTVVNFQSSLGQVNPPGEPFCYYASNTVVVTAPAFIYILDGVTIKATETVASLPTFTTFTFTRAELVTAGLVFGNTYTYKITDGDGTPYMQKNFTWLGGDIVSLLFSTGSANVSVYKVDAEEYNSPGTYTSKVFDTSLTTPYYSNFVATETIPANTAITYEFNVSSDGVSFDGWVAVVNGAIPAVNQKRYYKFRVNMSRSTSLTVLTTPTVTDVTVKAVNLSTYTSAEFDTTYTSPKGGDFTVTKTGTAVTYEVRQSTDGISWGGWSAQTEDSQIALTQQYWQYRATFTGEVAITQIDLPAIVNSGQYIHKCFNPGTFTDWGLFQANDITADGGSIAYAVVSGASCGAVELVGASWTAQPNNAKIVVGVNTYIGVRETFTLTAAESQAIVQDVTINFNVGGTSKPLASIVYDDRYLLAFDSDVGGNNDKIAILDKRDKWTIFDNITCASMSLYNRKWHCGTSETDGFVYLMDTGFNDDGGDYTASFRTKAYSFGDEDAEKEFDKLYVTLKTDATEPVIDITVSYVLDDSTSSNSLGTIALDEDSDAGILNAKVPFPLTQNLTGRYLDLEFSNTGQRDWTIFNTSVYFTLHPID
jgi:hypothetical protein